MDSVDVVPGTASLLVGEGVAMMSLELDATCTLGDGVAVMGSELDATCMLVIPCMPVEGVAILVEGVAILESIASFLCELGKGLNIDAVESRAPEVVAMMC